MLQAFKVVGEYGERVVDLLDQEHIL